MHSGGVGADDKLVARHEMVIGTKISGTVEVACTLSLGNGTLVFVTHISDEPVLLLAPQLTLRECA